MVREPHRTSPQKDAGVAENSGKPDVRFQTPPKGSRKANFMAVENRVKVIEDRAGGRRRKEKVVKRWWR